MSSEANPVVHSLKHAPKPDVKQVPLTQFVGYFLWLGTVGFGGPIALAGHMQQDLVEDRDWVRKEDYLEGLALAQLAPGPLAAQLAIYLGYIRAGVFGATAVGMAFVLPSFPMVLALSAAYVRFGGLPWMQGMFYGIGAAVIGIIARSAFKLTKLTIGKDKLLWAVFLLLPVSTAWTSQEIIWLFLLGGVVNLFAKAFPNRLPPRSTIPLLCRWHPVADLPVFRQGGNVRIRQRIGRRALPLRWRSRRASLADRPSIRGRGRSGHDYTGTCGHHGRFYRLPGGGPWRRHGGSSRHLSSGLPGCGCSRTFLQALGEEPAVECVRARRHCRRYRGNCRGGGGPSSSLGLRSAHNSDLFAEPRHTVSLENARARSYRVCWRCRFASTLCVKNRDGDE